MLLCQTGGPGGGVPCLHALSGAAGEPAPMTAAGWAAVDQGRDS